MTASAPPESGWELPIVDGPTEAFVLVRRACAQAGFTESGVTRRLGLSDIVNFTSRREGRVDSRRVGDALEVLIDLFMDQSSVPDAHVRQSLGPDVVQALEALGLVCPDAQDHAGLIGTMLMYPMAAILLISDRTHVQFSTTGEPPPDIVYPSITRSASVFLRMLPPSACGDFLELCAGNGVAALATATRARHVWSLDIADRATRVAHFNARLNGFDNVTTARGDLFEPVQGLTFDRIAAHPPYVPSFEQRLVYRDGGADGEFITRRIVTELPTYLRPGGRFLCNCIATDRTEAPLEVRLREWLGDSRDEFDVVVTVTSTEHPSEFYFKSAIHGAISFEEAERRHAAFKDMHVESLVYCAFVIERHAAPRVPGTLRLRRGPTTTGRELEQLCYWHARRDVPDLYTQIMGAFPRIDPGARLSNVQRIVDGKWSGEEFTLHTTWPFTVTLACPKDMAQFLARCDGTRSVKQVITALRQKGYLSARVPDTVVLGTLALCVSVGAIHLDANPVAHSLD